MIYVVSGLARVVVPAAVGGEPGIAGPIDFEWPRQVMATGIQVIPANGTPESLAQLSLGIVDVRHDNLELITDGVGREGGAFQPFSMPCLAMGGRNFTPFAMQRIVELHDVWRLRLKNFSGVAVSVASVALYWDEVER